MNAFVCGRARFHGQKQIMKSDVIAFSVQFGLNCDVTFIQMFLCVVKAFIEKAQK